MTPITLTSASLAELTLQQTLSQYRQHFGWSGGELALAIGLPPATLDTRLQLQWQGISLPLLCHGAELAHWLAPDLQQAALFSLPEPLQLALIERLGQPLGGITCSALTRPERNVQTDEPALQLLLQREEATSHSLAAAARALAEQVATTTIAAAAAVAPHPLPAVGRNGADHG